MAGTISKIFNLVKNMGWRYVTFRLRHEFLRRSGLLKRKFPAAPAAQQYITLQQWKAQPAKFFFGSKASLSIPRDPQPELKKRFGQIKEGKLLMFNSVLAYLGKDYDWVTNPDSGHRYDINKHWAEIADYSPEAGDIKAVWEKSRFSYLYDIIRYDYHFNEDCAAQVFADISSWIDGNPVNRGPNYRCSQEISLRVLNWLFALYYYRDSPALTDAVFDKMQYAIYWQMDHVYKNIHFSRIAVRNNHAITETLTLYLAGLFFPTLPNASVWKTKGKAWFEEEIAYQIYEDGTYLQFSMNYHRVVAQLLTWAITLSEKNNERFSDVVYERARKSFEFLRICMVEENGWLPNYGANDGALFFKLSDSHYRDYRPQLQALAAALGMDAGFSGTEDTGWYGIKPKGDTWQPANGLHSFTKGGYYIIREPETLTFIKCGSYKDRPSQADNLHLDIWYKGENILLDAGSFKYNTDFETVRYFSGTASHNTVMLGDNDQMLKGGRFIWYFWSQCKAATLAEDTDTFTFTGTISAFAHVSEGITHKRTVTKRKGKPYWDIKDELNDLPEYLQIKQLWHLPLENTSVTITALHKNGEAIPPILHEGWYSSLYSHKEETKELHFLTKEDVITASVIVVA
jgi:hypothetical protein